MSSINPTPQNQSGRPLQLLWGVQAIADELGLSERQTRYALAQGSIPGAKKVGNRWAITRAALEDHFLGDVK